MRLFLTAAALVASAATLSSAAFADDLPKEPPAKEAPKGADAAKWEADFDAAVARAKSEGKDLLVDFTGSDWCGWCIKLHDEVFSKEAFVSAATKDYVLVALDYPNGPEAKAKVPNPARNQELQRKYGIRGFPTVLLMTPEGDVFGQTGYAQGGPEPYVENLGKLRVGGKAALAEVIELEKSVAAATGDAKADLIDKALDRLGALEPGAASGARLAKILREGFTLDPKDEKGLKSRLLGALLTAGHADEGVAAEARALDPKNEKQLLEKVVNFEITLVDSEEGVKSALASIEALEATGNWKDAASRAIPLANAAFWCKQVLKDDEKAKVWARKLKAVAADDPRFARLYDAILGDEAKEPEKGHAPAEPAPAPEKK